MNVDGYIWIGRGGREGGEGESVRDLGERRRHRLGGVKRQLQIGVVV